MRTVKYGIIASLVVIAMLAVNVQGAFIVEAIEGGLANANYTGTGRISTAYPIGSDAVGCLATNGVFGATGDHVYVFSYTPGTDMDNTVIAAGRDLGNGDLASGLVGSCSGVYNVYATWPVSTNVDADGCYFTTTSDGPDAVTGTFNQNAPSIGSDKWVLIAEDVTLTAGVTYTITQTANDPTWVSMRSHGVMWEVVVPEYAPVTVSETDLYVAEGGGEDTYTVVLDQQPTSDYVYVHMVPADETDPNNDIVFVVNPGGGDVEVAGPLTLTFLPGDWDVPQTVRVKAKDDDLVEFDHFVLIRHSTEPNNINPLDPPDPDFVGGFAGFVKVHITDNEVPQIRIVETNFSTDVTEQGATDTYDVVLLYPVEATKTVTVTINASVGDETLVDVGSGPVAIAQLTFTDSDWMTPQTVTVSAIDDAVTEFVHTGTIVHSAASTDAGYNGLAVPSVTVYIEDNDCGAWGYQDMDFNFDCVVDLADFADIAAAWLACTQPYGSNCVDLL